MASGTLVIQKKEYSRPTFGWLGLAAAGTDDVRVSGVVLSSHRVEGVGRGRRGVVGQEVGLLRHPGSRRLVGVVDRATLPANGTVRYPLKKQKTQNLLLDKTN